MYLAPAGRLFYFRSLNLGDSINTPILVAVPMGNNIFARYLQQPTEYQLST